MTLNLKIVFHVEDADTGEDLNPPQQVVISLDDGELIRIRNTVAAKFAENSPEFEPLYRAMQVAWVRELLRTAVISMAGSVQNLVLPLLGLAR